MCRIGLLNRNLVTTVGIRAVTVPLIPFPVQFWLVFQQKPRFRFGSVGVKVNRVFLFQLHDLVRPISELTQRR